MQLKHGHIGKKISGDWRLLRCGCGERWKKITWRDMKTNEEVLQMVQEERSLMDVIWRRKRLGMLNEFLKESSYAELKRKAENRNERRIWKPRTCLTAEHLRRIHR